MIYGNLNYCRCQAESETAESETLALMRQRMASDYPNIKVAGTYSPPFKPIYSSTELDEMIKTINAAAPDVLWVGMTAPKQEKWIYQNREKLNVKFIGAVGGAFDFFSGKIKRNEYPWFLDHGLEWLPRLLQEPRRLWRRMFVSAPVFLLHVLRQRFGGWEIRDQGYKGTAAPAPSGSEPWVVSVRSHKIQDWCRRKNSKIKQNRHTCESRYPVISSSYKALGTGFTGVTTFYETIRISSLK